MVGCGGASPHGLPITGINKVNVSCVTCFDNKVCKSIKQTKKKLKTDNIFRDVNSSVAEEREQKLNDTVVIQGYTTLGYQRTV